MAENEPIHPGSFVGDTVEEFKKLPTWGKIAIAIGLVAVVGIAIYLRSRSSSQSGVTSGISTGSAGLPTGNGSTDLSGGTAAGPSSSSNTHVPADVQNGFINKFQNLLSGTSGKGLIGSGATVYSAGGQIYATQPGGIVALLSSILPTGTKVFQGGSGRWWYQLPGEHTQYLLTSGAGNPVTNGIGQSVKTPNGALTIGQTTSAVSANNQLPVTH